MQNEIVQYSTLQARKGGQGMLVPPECHEGNTTASAVLLILWNVNTADGTIRSGPSIQRGLGCDGRNDQKELFGVLRGCGVGGV